MNLPLTRLASLAGALLLIGSCSSGSGQSAAPRNQEDICAVFAQRPGWREAALASERRWGAPVPVQMAIIWRESSFRSDVRPRRTYALGFIPTGRLSSAYGFAQAIDGTWDWYREETGNSGAERTDFEDAIDFVGWYMARTATENGVGMHDAYNHYLAYHEGHSGHRRGSHQSKGWLLDVASRVAGRAATYRGQLRACS